MKTTKQNTDLAKKSNTKESKLGKLASMTLNLNENRFSADNVIDAYLKGHDEGSGSNLSVQFGDSLQILRNSLVAASDYFNNYLTDDDCISLFFKPHFPNKVSFLFAINENIYFNEERRKELYTTSSKYMQDKPYVYFSFMPCKDKASINEYSIKADNYIEI